MSVFEEALWLSSEDWVDSFPTNIPKHKFSKKHNKIINELIYSENEKVKFKLSKRTIKVLIIAAVLLALASTAFAFPESREFIINKFFNHSQYNVVYNGKVKKVDSLTVNYVPSGFEKVEDHGYSYVYKNGDKEFVVEKMTIDTSIGYDTEKYENEIIEINGVDAVYYRSNNVNNGIIFNNANYIFWISGNIEKEELIKIAQNVE